MTYKIFTLNNNFFQNNALEYLSVYKFRNIKRHPLSYMFNPLNLKTMSIQYKAIAKGRPGVVGGGDRKFYAQIVRGRPIQFRTFIEEIADMNTLNTADVYAVLESFLQMSNKYLSQGKIIDMGQLGSFIPSLLSNAEETSEDVDSNTIKRLKINFRPSSLLKDKLSTVKYQKVNGNNNTAGDEVGTTLSS